MQLATLHKFTFATEVQHTTVLLCSFTILCHYSSLLRWNLVRLTGAGSLFGAQTQAMTAQTPAFPGEHNHIAQHTIHTHFLSYSPLYRNLSMSCHLDMAIKARIRLVSLPTRMTRDNLDKRRRKLLAVVASRRLYEDLDERCLGWCC